MKTIIFDFNNIQTFSGFYRTFQKKFILPPDIPDNLDGLWDVLTGMIELPVKIEFHHLSPKKLDKFQNLISLFEESENETNHMLLFSYFLYK